MSRVILYISVQLFHFRAVDDALLGDDGGLGLNAWRDVTGGDVPLAELTSNLSLLGVAIAVGSLGVSLLTTVSLATLLLNTGWTSLTLGLPTEGVNGVAEWIWDDRELFDAADFDILADSAVKMLIIYHKSLNIY